MKTSYPIVADFQLAAVTDIYQREIPRDLTGQNVIRATLTRLENYEALYPGRFTPEIEMLRGRAFADLGAFASAKRRFQRCAAFDTPFQSQAKEAALIAAEFETVLSRPSQASDLETLFNRMAACHLLRSNRSRNVTAERAGKHWRGLRRNTPKRRLLNSWSAHQTLLPEGEKRAADAFARLVPRPRRKPSFSRPCAASSPVPSRPGSNAGADT